MAQTSVVLPLGIPEHPCILPTPASLRSRTLGANWSCVRAINHIPFIVSIVKGRAKDNCHISILYLTLKQVIAGLLPGILLPVRTKELSAVTVWTVTVTQSALTMKPGSEETTKSNAPDRESIAKHMSRWLCQTFLCSSPK